MNSSAIVLSTLGNQAKPLVELRDVQFRYSAGARPVLEGLSLVVPRGKVTAIMGASGGGKTTVLRLIGGLQKATQGEVLFDGQDMGTFAHSQIYAARRRMGMLFQFGALFTDMSVFDNVAFPLREHTLLSESMIRDIVLMKLHAVGLRGARDLMPGEISGGMARRVALARAIALDPELVSHDLDETFRIADQVIILGNGRVAAQGAPEDVRHSPDPLVQQFINAQPEGPVHFHYPGADLRTDFGLEAFRNQP